MMEVIVEVCQIVDQIVSEKKADPMCMPPPRTPWIMMKIEVVWQAYKQVKFFTYLGGAVLKSPDNMPTQITRLTYACWMHVRWSLRELYDQQKVALSHKTRMVKADVTNR